MPGKTLRRLSAGAMFLLLSTAALAGRFADYLDAIDLNDYSLTIHLYANEADYQGVEDTLILYPVPGNYGHAVIETDPFFIRGSNFGLRKVFDNGWSFGGLLNLQTKGYGSNDSDILLGMRRRGWTLQGGGLLGRRLGPLQVDLIGSADMLGEHNGHQFEVRLAVPFVRERFFLIPQVEFRYESAELVNHYFGVRPEEAAPGRPAYVPDAAVTASVVIDGEWRIHRRWYLSSSIGLDVLPDEIRNSPLVDDATSWRLNVGIAYDRGAWVEPGSVGQQTSMDFEIGTGLFFLLAESNVDLGNASVSPGKLESAQGLEDRSISIPVDFVWRVGRFHRFDASYFRLDRDATNDLIAPLTVGAVTFEPGESLSTELNTQVLRFGYGFSFLRDAQKELTLFGGVHVTDIEYRVRGSTAALFASTTAILPVVGLHFEATALERLTVGAGLELFALDFDDHSGELVDAYVAGRYAVTEHVQAGVGFRFYRQDIDSGDGSLLGDYRIEYRGPFVSLRVRF